MRKNLPESPRWLLMHGRERGGRGGGRRNREAHAGDRAAPSGPIDESKAIEITPANNIGFIALARTLFVHYPRRSILGASLMITQSFLYNAIFFTYALVLTKIYNVPATDTRLLLHLLRARESHRAAHPRPSVRHHRASQDDRGHLHPVRHPPRRSAPCCSTPGRLNAVTQTVCWCVIFFFASAGASSAYLTVSEIFPVEVRAKAIAVFFAIAQSFGAFGPWLYGELIGNGQDHFRLFIGYLIGAGVMVIGGLVAIVFGVDAEQSRSRTSPSPCRPSARPPTSRR